jgi:hypothetical protein
MRKTFLLIIKFCHPNFSSKKRKWIILISLSGKAKNKLYGTFSKKKTFCRALSFLRENRAAKNKG